MPTIVRQWLNCSNPWLVVGQHYLKKGQKQQIHVFEKMTETNGVFAEVDLHGNKQPLEVPRQGLRFFRKTDKKPEIVLEMAWVKFLQVEQSAEWLLELEKSDVRAVILKNYRDRGQLDLAQALHTSEHKLRAGKKKIAKALEDLFLWLCQRGQAWREFGKMNIKAAGQTA